MGVENFATKTVAQRQENLNRRNSFFRNLLPKTDPIPSLKMLAAVGLLVLIGMLPNKLGAQNANFFHMQRVQMLQRYEVIADTVNHRAFMITHTQVTYTGWYFKRYGGADEAKYAVKDPQTYVPETKGSEIQLPSKYGLDKTYFYIKTEQQDAFKNNLNSQKPGSIQVGIGFRF